ncbi:hypothetical protein IFM89_001008 [Coptis chinensis]|uniref:BED-type domain-containing protein n=1 Tax=Coptis chinensis TaxID=261450 RepID=A0A835IMM2_9MAGN|nr:hypothetical protein IFM89_001008 [Coptis chinensis]
MVRGKDPFWQYGEDLKGHFTCKFCKYKKSGGISRLKALLSCLPGMDVVGCTFVPEDVQAEAILLVKEKERPNKKLKTRSSSLNGGVQHEECGNGNDEPEIPNEAIGNANDATSNATPPTRDDIIFEELFGSSMR